MSKLLILLTIVSVLFLNNTTSVSVQGQRWEPISRSIWSFGIMTVSTSKISWKSGQASAYTTVLDDGDTIISLTSAPKFNDIACRYIKLSRDGNDLIVSFYKTKADMQRANMSLEGTYEKIKR